MHLSDMKGRKVALWNLPSLKLSKVSDKRQFGFANRSNLQHTLLDALNLKDDDGNIKNDDDRLKCCTSVVGYQNLDGFVRVELNDGTKVDASALLACDARDESADRCCRQIKPFNCSLRSSWRRSFEAERFFNSVGRSTLCV